jgi:hypothetical protein
MQQTRSQTVEQIPVAGNGGGGGIAKVPPVWKLSGSGSGPEVEVEEPWQLALGRIHWPAILGAYAGSWAAGALIGYMAQGAAQGAVNGGLASSSVWSAAETIHQWRTFNRSVAVGFLAISAGSLYWALRRKP